jgi:hypothetical protein
VSYILCVYKAFLEKPLTNPRPLHDGQEEGGLALGGCGVGKVTVQGEFFRQGEHRYHQQLKFFAHRFRDLLPLFSICDLLENKAISQQTSISGHMVTETILLIKVGAIPP